MCVRVDVRCVWVLRVVVCLSALFAGPVRACVLSGLPTAHGRHRSTRDGAAPIPPVAVRGPHPPPQLDEVGRERQVQQQGSQRAEALAERPAEMAQAMVPLAGALARGGG